jgi:hypothetical protein
MSSGGSTPTRANITQHEPDLTAAARVLYHPAM